MHGSVHAELAAANTEFQRITCFFRNGMDRQVLLQVLGIYLYDQIIKTTASAKLCNISSVVGSLYTEYVPRFHHLLVLTWTRCQIIHSQINLGYLGFRFTHLSRSTKLQIGRVRCSKIV